MYTTHEAVAEILGNEYDAAVAPSLVPFIAIAEEWVAQLLVPLGTMSDASLEKIERYLAAHVYGITSPRLSSEAYGQGDIDLTIQGKVDFGLFLTHFGQTAVALDTSGTLAAYAQKATGKGNNNTQRASLKWLGRKYDAYGNVAESLSSE